MNKDLGIKIGFILVLLVSVYLIVAGVLTGEDEVETDDIVYETGLKLSTYSLNMNVGDEDTIIATVLPDNATYKDVTWNSANNSIITVYNGNVKAVGVGNTIITVRTSQVNISKVINVKVNGETPKKVLVDKINVEKSTIELFVGDNVSINYTIEPSNASNKKIGFYTSDKNIAGFDANGHIVGVSKGEATVTLKSNNDKSASIKVIVKEKDIDVSGVKVSKSSLTLKEGSSETITASVTPKNATNQTITWSSSNNDIATVENGKITAIKEGTATIKATSANGKFKEVKVTVKKKEEEPKDTYTVGPGNEAEGIGRTITYMGRTFTHYYQDKINYTYGHGYTLAGNGCGPVSLAIVLSGYPEIANKSPQNVADRVGQYGTFNLLINVARGYGLTVEGPRYYNSNDRNQTAINNLANEANQKLREGYQIIALVSGNGGCWGCSVANKYSVGNHFIAIIGIAKDGQALIMNPMSIRSSEGTMEEIIKWYMPSGGKGLIYLKK